MPNPNQCCYLCDVTLKLFSLSLMQFFCQHIIVSNSGAPGVSDGNAKGCLWHNLMSLEGPISDAVG